MRYGRKLTHPCPKECGGQEIECFTYCHGTHVDVVCLACGAKDKVPMWKPREQRIHVENPSLDDMKTGKDADTMKKMEQNLHPFVQKVFAEGILTSRTFGFLGNEDARSAMKSAVTEVMGEDAAGIISKNMWTEPKISIDMPEKT